MSQSNVPDKRIHISISFVLSNVHVSLVLIPNSPDELPKLIKELHVLSNKAGLKLNLAKTKIMYNELVDQIKYTRDTGKSRRILILGPQLGISSPRNY